MNAPARLLTTAQAGFDAARRQGLAGQIGGHGFTAQVAAALPAGWAPYPGGDVPALQARLEAAVAPLDGVLLDTVIDAPESPLAATAATSGDGADDATLARWIATRLDLPVPARVSVQSHARRGVHLLDAGTPQARSEYWRRFRFQSAHRLPHVPVGHKCGRMHGHGFEAVVHAQADNTAPADNIHDRIDAAWAPLHMALNYRCLNEIEGLDNPTSEVLASWLWQRLQPALPGLRGVTVFETASCGAHVDGQVHRIWKDFSFDSATQLIHAPAHDPRAGLHGHTYLLRLHLQAALDPLRGWAVDFGEVKSAFKPVFESIDHRTLDRLKGLADGDCASLAQWILHRTQPLLPALNRIDLQETAGNGCLLLAGGSEQPLLPA